MTVPTPPTAIDGDPAHITDRFDGRRVDVPRAIRDRWISEGIDVSEDASDRAEAGRDWWPVAIGWAARGQVPSRPAIVVRPRTVTEVSSVLAACSAKGIPVTPVAGRSGVCGASVPVFGGVALDCTGLLGEVVVDETSLVAEVPAGIFGPDLEATLAGIGSGYTMGHWPQSMDLSTVGGWLACRGAGQYSTRYGKIEDMVIGLEVVLADGTIVHTEGHAPRAATGPNLTQLFVGSEGTLGVITSARMRVHPKPSATQRRVHGFPTFAEGLDACRRILRRGATPAVLRLYDEVESERHFDRGDTCVLVVLDECDPILLAATMEVVDQECAEVPSLDPALVTRWLDRRNDVSALAPLWRAGIVVDTIEVAASWSVLPDLGTEVIAALVALEGTLSSSVHESHAYPDGACLYFTFAGRGPEPSAVAAGEDAPLSRNLEWEETYYRLAWQVATDAVRRHGGAISHHHGIGLNRSRFLPEALGTGFGVLTGIKAVLDPHGILNPGKLGLPTSFGEVPWS